MEDGPSVDTEPEATTNRALRCLKRHLARRVWRLLIDSEIDRSVITTENPEKPALAANCGGGLT